MTRPKPFHLKACSSQYLWVDLRIHITDRATKTFFEKEDILIPLGLCMSVLTSVNALCSGVYTEVNAAL